MLCYYKQANSEKTERQDRNRGHKNADDDAPLFVVVVIVEAASTTVTSIFGSVVCVVEITSFYAGTCWKKRASLLCWDGFRQERERGTQHHETEIE